MKQDHTMLRIGRATEMLPRSQDYAVTNVAVRFDDRAAFLGIIAMREEQITKFGHTAEQDAKLPGDYLIREAMKRQTMAIEDLQFGKGNDRAIKQLERSAALTIAAITRLKGEAE